MALGILIGLFCGFILAMPPGPINFAVLEKSINSPRWKYLPVIFGGVTGDTIYCFIAVVYQISSEKLELVKVVFSAFGGVFLVGLGLYTIFFKRNKHHPSYQEPSYHSQFLKGLLIALSNPFYIIALIALTEVLYSLGLLIPDFIDNLFFVIGFQCGTFCWLITMGRFAARYSQKLSGSLDRIQQYCGWIFLIFGLYMIGKFIRLMWLK